MADQLRSFLKKELPVLFPVRWDQETMEERDGTNPRMQAYLESYLEDFLTAANKVLMKNDLESLWDSISELLNENKRLAGLTRLLRTTLIEHDKTASNSPGNKRNYLNQLDALAAKINLPLVQALFAWRLAEETSYLDTKKVSKLSEKYSTIALSCKMIAKDIEKAHTKTRQKLTNKLTGGLSSKAKEVEKIMETLYLARRNELLDWIGFIGQHPSSKSIQETADPYQPILPKSYGIEVEAWIKTLPQKLPILQSDLAAMGQANAQPPVVPNVSLNAAAPAVPVVAPMAPPAAPEVAPMAPPLPTSMNTTGITEKGNNDNVEVKPGRKVLRQGSPLGDFAEAVAGVPGAYRPNTTDYASTREEMNNAFLKPTQPVGIEKYMTVGEFSPQKIAHLLKQPGPANNLDKLEKIHQLNRTRRNLVFSETDVEKAIKQISEMLKTKKFDVTPYQNKLVLGTPDEQAKARHELRVLGWIMYQLMNNQLDRKYVKYVDRYVEAKFRHYLWQGLSIPGLIIVVSVVAAGAATGVGIVFAGAAGLLFTMISLAEGLAYQITSYQDRKALRKEAAEEAIKRVRTTQQPGKAYDLLRIILKLLADDEEFAAEDRKFEMEQSPLFKNAMKAPNASALPLPSGNDRWENFSNNNSVTVGGKRHKKTRKHKKGKQGTRKH